MTPYPHHRLNFNALSYSFKIQIHFSQLNDGTFHWRGGGTIQFLNQAESHFVLMIGLLSSAPAENPAPSWRNEHPWLGKLDWQAALLINGRKGAASTADELEVEEQLKLAT